MTPPLPPEEARRLALRFCGPAKPSKIVARVTTAEPQDDAPKRIRDAANAIWGVTPRQLRSASKFKPVVVARFACYAALTAQGFTSTKAAAVMGRTCHGTVGSGLIAYQNLIETDRHYAAQVVRFERLVAQFLSGNAVPTDRGCVPLPPHVGEPLHSPACRQG